MNTARLSLQQRLGAVERRVRRTPPVRGLLSVMDGYNTAGGGLAASGLAFSALFAIVPGLLLIVSLLVLAVDDPETRRQAIQWIVDTVPPLTQVATQIVQNLADSARVGSIVGFVGFVWGASGFYLALDAALGRFFPARRGRDPIRGRIRGVIAVLLVVVGVIAAFSASTLLAGILVPLKGLSPILSPLVSVLGASVACLACYELIPVEPPSVRAALPAAFAAGAVIGLLTSLFGLIGSFLVAGVSGLGIIASVFIALIWFGYVFQALLYGASFARIRDVQVKRQRSEVPII
jgi:membrane protein